MAYILGNKCAKNLCKRTVLLQLIIKNVVTCFLEHSVVLSPSFWVSRTTGLEGVSESEWVVYDDSDFFSN